MHNLAVITLLSGSKPLKDRWETLIPNDAKLLINNPDNLEISHPVFYESKVIIKKDPFDNYVDYEANLLTQIIPILNNLVLNVPEDCEYILLLDDDVFPLSPFIDILISNIKDDISFSCLMYPQSGWNESSEFACFTINSNLEDQSPINCHPRPEEKLFVKWGGLGCMMCKPEDLKKILPFKIEKNLLQLKGYDWMMGYDAEKIGKKILADPSVKCLHNKI